MCAGYFLCGKELCNLLSRECLFTCSPVRSVICGLEIVERVVEGRWPYLRPLLCPQSHSDEMGQLMQRCWSEDVNERPDFNQIKVLLRKNNRYLKHKSPHKHVTNWQKKKIFFFQHQDLWLKCICITYYLYS